MSRMKLSGQTQGKLIFAYDIREGHIEYKKLIPVINKFLVKEGIEAMVEEKELGDIIGEVLFRVNEEVYENLQLILEGEKKELNIEKILKDTLEIVLKK